MCGARARAHSTQKLSRVWLAFARDLVHSASSIACSLTVRTCPSAIGCALAWSHPTDRQCPLTFPAQNTHTHTHTTKYTRLCAVRRDTTERREARERRKYDRHNEYALLIILCWAAECARITRGNMTHTKTKMKRRTFAAQTGSDVRNT